MSSNRKYTGAGLFFLLLLSLFSLSVLHEAFADPTGAVITSASTEQRANITAPSRADARSTITTLLVDAIQQSGFWKGYVGNVTGSLTLDNANNFTLYDWDLATLTGQVFASRNGTLDWSSVSCANQTDIQTESVFHNMTDTDNDDLNNTFNWSVHRQFDVGVTTIAANSCNSTVMYVNDTRQVPTGSSPFQEVLIKDANDQFVLMTSIDDDAFSFNNNGSTTQTFDFQMIVPESDVKASPTTYFFYVELR